MKVERYKNSKKKRKVKAMKFQRHENCMSVLGQAKKRFFFRISYRTPHFGWKFILKSTNRT